jgi:hypothetical protein
VERQDLRHAVTRIRLEYTQMPELRLTREQVRRLLDLTPDTCEVALATLVQSGFLVKSDAQQFLRGVTRSPGSRTSLG